MNQGRRVQQLDTVLLLQVLPLPLAVLHAYDHSDPFAGMLRRSGYDLLEEVAIPAFPALGFLRTIELV